MRRVVEEPEPVLLGVEEVLDPDCAQGSADGVGLLRVPLPRVGLAGLPAVPIIP
jgi:hypothetical protein